MLCVLLAACEDEALRGKCYRKWTVYRKESVIKRKCYQEEIAIAENGKERRQVIGRMLYEEKSRQKCIFI